MCITHLTRPTQESVTDRHTDWQMDRDTDKHTDDRELIPLCHSADAGDQNLNQELHSTNSTQTITI